MSLGLNLNRYKNIFFLKGDSELDLMDQIRSIRGEVEVLQIVVSGGKHIAWLNTNMKVVKVKKSKKEEVENGNSSSL